MTLGHCFHVNTHLFRETIVSDYRHPGCKCPAGFEGKHCESLSGVRSPTVEIIDDEETDGDSKGGMSTAGIIVLVLFLDLVILGGIGAYIYHKRQSRQREVLAEHFSFEQNLQQQPPTLGDILSVNSERSSMPDDSQRSGSFTSSVNGDGIFRVEEQSGPDLVNVNIL